MNTTLKHRLRRTPIGITWSQIRRSYIQTQEISRWKRLGRPVPPPHSYKQQVVREYAKRFSTSIFIETGTHKGNMIFAMRNSFSEIYSIELSPNYYEKARERFSEFSHIQIFQGDSAKVLPEVLSDVNTKCLFWLDGHYSCGNTAKGELETPVRAELNHIFKHQGMDHVILVDDARCFTGENDYPTIEELRTLVSKHRPEWVIEVNDDIIRIHDCKK